jgi:hypothetical protein
MLRLGLPGLIDEQPPQGFAAEPVVHPESAAEVG